MIENVNGTTVLDKKKDDLEKLKTTNFKTKYLIVVSTIIFSSLVLLFAFFALVGVVAYNYSNGVGFTIGTYIGILIPLAFAIINLAFSLFFLFKLRKNISDIKIKIIDNPND